MSSTSRNSNMTTEQNQRNGRPRSSSTAPQRLSLRSPSFRASRPFRAPSLARHQSSEVEESFHEEERSTLSRGIESLTYGLVNSILTIPALYGYAAIIFKDGAYQDDLAPLAKLVLFSSVVHQVVFSFKSSLPFAIGQVQDAGLIFLSSMATSIASNCDKTENILPTTLVTLSISTALLGVAVYLVGKFQLATLVSYLPMPVVGGYLAFIGYFCLQAGIGLTIGAEITTLNDWAKIATLDNLLFVAPALLGGVALAIVEKKAGSWLALPGAIVSLPIVFYIVLLFSGKSMDDAREEGWMSSIETEDGQPFWYVWQMFELSKVEWEQIPNQFVTWLSMTFVVSFSSCLDVVAIEMDMGKELDINHELKTVGLSNMISGVSGGYTGSYIFSQTIFTYRTKTNSRLVGLVVFVSEFLLFLAPFNIMAFVPKYFFAATLIYIGFDLCTEWLVHVYQKVSLKEYVVLMGTFVFITASGDLILGIAVGCAFAIINFIICYATVEHVEVSGKRSSHILREFESRKILSKFAAEDVAVIRLHGFLFFGSSVQIVKKAKQLVGGSQKEDLVENRSANRLGFWGGVKRWMSSNSGHNVPLLSDDGSDPIHSYSSLNGSESNDIPSESNGAKYLIVDFSRVTGMDATAISSGLMRIKQLAVTHPGLKMVFTALRPEFESLLRANEVITDDPDDLVRIRVFDELDDGLGHIENKIIRSRSSEERLDYMLTPTFPDIPYAFQGTNLSSVVSSIKSMPDAAWALESIFLNFFSSDPEGLSDLCSYFGLMRIEKGRVLFDVDSEADMFYVVMVGSLATIVPKNGDMAITHFPKPSCFVDTASLRHTCTIVQKALHGSFVGELQFVLREKRTFACIATSETALFYMTRSRWISLCEEQPDLALCLAKSINKNLALVMMSMLAE